MTQHYGQRQLFGGHKPSGTGEAVVEPRSAVPPSFFVEVLLRFYSSWVRLGVPFDGYGEWVERSRADGHAFRRVGLWRGGPGGVLMRVGA